MRYHRLHYKESHWTTIEIKVIFFIPKNNSVSKWVPVFEAGIILRLTVKFSLKEQPPHNNAIRSNQTILIIY
jgi:hypothetical protein